MYTKGVNVSTACSLKWSILACGYFTQLQNDCRYWGWFDFIFSTGTWANDTCHSLFKKLCLKISISRTGKISNILFISYVIALLFFGSIVCIQKLSYGECNHNGLRQSTALGKDYATDVQILGQYKCIIVLLTVKLQLYSNITI